MMDYVYGRERILTWAGERWTLHVLCLRGLHFRQWAYSLKKKKKKAISLSGIYILSLCEEELDWSSCSHSDCMLLNLTPTCMNQV